MKLIGVDVDALAKRLSELRQEQRSPKRERKRQSGLRRTQDSLCTILRGQNENR